jgi:hypothetical protein
MSLYSVSTFFFNPLVERAKKGGNNKLTSELIILGKSISLFWDLTNKFLIDYL